MEKFHTPNCVITSGTLTLSAGSLWPVVCATDFFKRHFCILMIHHNLNGLLRNSLKSRFSWKHKKTPFSLEWFLKVFFYFVSCFLNVCQILFILICKSFESKFLNTGTFFTQIGCFQSRD